MNPKEYGREYSMDYHLKIKGKKRLSRRELEGIQLLAEGLFNNEVSDKLS
jgi:DNA-binding NarL/FixJ family response regulator